MSIPGDRYIPPSAVETVAVVAAADPVVAPVESAVSWGAILAGAAAAAALSLILVILGVGLGLSSVSPWSFEGVSAETFGWSSIAWITFTAIVASGLGGYIAGRLRTKWTRLHGDETYFRDTAHGFLSWAIATLLAAGLLTSAISGILGAGVKAAGATAGAASGAAGGLATLGAAASVPGTQDGDLQYWVDSLFRRTTPTATSAPGTPVEPMPATAGAVPPPPARAPAGVEPMPGTVPPPPGQGPAADRPGARAEVARIVLNSLQSPTMDAADAQYLAQLVSAQTGMSQAEAQARVTDMQTRLRAAIDKAKQQAKQAADDARKATAYAALWLFITLLVGAFCASLFATWGGRRRDLY
ncbi:hypothetical protein P6166_12085 [Stenotrophomonas sp. HITSZ_GD]|uniref:hypothetical protein n=1 Tax=Stenotrophomonas sp. HITSZ_GD TaxID=3037248 RepID=UPI00240E874A|nr:hypothetical protein [Stenotrophomonas sp. HITSZ_GD]MDG2526095.1 hypothetical protein [Stenotrophomonas sp. HITSZ_GD]